MNKIERFSKMGIRFGFLLMIGILIGLMGCNDSKELSVVETFLVDFNSLTETELEVAMHRVIIEDSPNAKYAYYELGNIFYDRSRNDTVQPDRDSLTGTNALLDSSLVYMGLAAELDSSFAEPLVNMGRIWDDLSAGRSPQARTAMKKATDLYKRALEINPADEKARCNLGSLYFEKRQHAKAISQYRIALEHNPKSALAHYHLAIMFAESKMYEEALVEWKAAAKSDKKGEIGERSRDNIRVINDLLNSEIPANVIGDTGH